MMSREKKSCFRSWIGVDLHLKTVTLCSVDRKGNVLARLTCPTKCVGRIGRFISDQPRPCHLVVETMGSVEWFVDRFESLADRIDLADALDYWAGLTPDNKTSAGRTQSGKITKAGNATLRWALGNAAVCMSQSDPKQKAIRNRLVNKVGKAKANAAKKRRKAGKKTVHPAEA